jgi:PAS domain S-box-containing protein
MYDFVRHVGSTWHKLYWALMLVGSCLFVFAFALDKLLPSAHLGTTIGINITLAALALLCILYELLLYKIIAKRTSESQATLIGAMLFALILVAGLSSTGFKVAGLVYIIPWIILGLFSGMFGMTIACGSIFLSFAFVLSRANFQFAHIGTIGLIFLAANALLSLGGGLFWRTRYSDQQTSTLSKFSTMLRSNQQQSEILVQSITDGLVVFNTEGKISLINSAASAMTDWPVNDASGLDIRQVVKLQDEHGIEIPEDKNPFSQALSRKEHIDQMSVTLNSREQKAHMVSLVVSPILLPKTNEFAGAVAVIRDISDQHAVDQQRADFISTAAHEMRTPVAAIEGYLALALNDKVSTIDARARGYLEKAHGSTQHLGQLFQDLLTSSKAEDGRLISHPTAVELSSYLQQLTDDLRFTAEKKGLFVEFVMGTTTGMVDATSHDLSATHMIKPLYYVEVDPDRLREVITNLFDNACKYTEQGKISIGLTGNNDVVQMYVRDTGHGIPSEDIPHLFQKFYRVDNSATRTIGGTGLGLFICRKIIELYHGRIWVESQQDKGSTFFINLPRISTERATDVVAANKEAAISKVAVN